MKKIISKITGMLKSLWASIRGNSTQQSNNRIVKIAVKFFILMLVLTVLSRAAYAVTLTKVTITTAESKTIVHQISGSGEVKSKQQQAVGINLPDLIVKTVYVKNGESVKKGEKLYKLDENILNEIIELKSNELNVINLQIKNYSKQTDEEGNNSNSDVPPETILERDAKQKELNKYIELRNDEGIIRAPKKSIINTVNATPGNTASMSDIVYDDISSGIFLEGNFSIDDKEYVKKGAEASVEGSSDGINSDKLTVKSTEIDSEDPTMIKAVIPLPDDSFNVGEQIDVVIKSESETSGLCIPREAVHEDGTGMRYVYIVTEIDTVLGSQFKATKLGVDVLDSDSIDAVIEGIDVEQQIIIESTRDISDGMKIRITEGINNENSVEME